MPRRLLLILGLALLSGCERRAGERHPAMAADSGGGEAFFPGTRDSLDSALFSPRLIDKPTVIVFWLPAGDTLRPDDAAAASDDLRYYTQQVAATLEANGIALLPTSAETVYVELPNHKRRAVLLAGLDYPYGYLFVDPGGPERILTGIYADDELLDEIDAYFDLSEDSTTTTPRIST